MSSIKKKTIVRTSAVIASILMLFSAYEIHKRTEQKKEQLRRIGTVKVISYNPNTEEAEVTEEIYGTIQIIESEEGLQIYVFTE